jgi:exodeoxyribonuclease-3
MRIISYNVNGIRSAIKKGFIDWLADSDADIVCIQELKAQENQIDNSLFNSLGYDVFAFSAKKKGYSGVAILSRLKPDNVTKGIGVEKFDDEGRFIRADYGDVSVISTYFPSGSSGSERQNVKMEWLDVFTEYVEKLRLERSKLIINGDFNICRLWIDIHNPQGHINSSGFLPEEREWFAKFLSLGYIDAFREFDDRANQYSWWSFRAASRERNKGWRIDYNIVTENLKPNLVNAGIMKDVVHSDHCPVYVDINL